MTQPAWIDIDEIPKRLERLRLRGRRVFGSESHGFRLNATLTEKELVAFEQQNHIALPADYREFLVRLGNGGAGPCFGIHKLGLNEDDKPWDPTWEVGELSKPFPHSAAWNPVPWDPERDDPDDDVLEGIAAEYFAVKHINGAFPVCQHGCNIRTWLVVTGREAGHVWLDRRVEWRGLLPVFTRGAEHATFRDWYLDWLRDAE